MFADTSLDFDTYMFTFGKHKDEYLKDVFEFDASYILWCSENLKWFELSDDDLLEVESKALVERDEREYYHPSDRGNMSSATDYGLEVYGDHNCYGI